VKDLCKKYELEKKDILSHCDLEPKKTCPNFDLHKLVAGWGWQ
jgi:N-acetyl-anhydromuramyl-L-alanine amidase AmpD